MGDYIFDEFYDWEDVGRIVVELICCVVIVGVGVYDKSFVEYNIFRIKICV